MLGHIDAIANLAVKDVSAAKGFYKEILGLTLLESDEPSVAVFKSGNTTIFVYESQYAATNQATGITWAVGEDLENIVHALKAKGVIFEHYDMPDTVLEGDIHISGNMKNAWFKDPDGNILSLIP